MKRPRADSMTGFFGVSFDPRSSKYCASLRLSGKKESLGSDFETPEEAALAYNEFVIRFKLQMPLNQLSPLVISKINTRKADRNREAAEMHTKKIINYKKGPEAKIQDDLIEFLEDRKWFVKVMHGNMYQIGVPDLFICQRKFGWRFVEVKYKDSYRFTPAQLETFPRLTAEGVGVWILTAATEDEYAKLFQPPNWWQFLEAMK